MENWKYFSSNNFGNYDGYNLYWKQAQVYSRFGSEDMERFIRIFDQLADSSVNKRKLFTNSAVKDHGNHFG